MIDAGINQRETSTLRLSVFGYAIETGPDKGTEVRSSPRVYKQDGTCENWRLVKILNLKGKNL